MYFPRFREVLITAVEQLNKLARHTIKSVAINLMS
jgi:hypothetical protein